MFKGLPLIVLCIWIQGCAYYADNLDHFQLRESNSFFSSQKNIPIKIRYFKNWSDPDTSNDLIFDFNSHFKNEGITFNRATDTDRNYIELSILVDYTDEIRSEDGHSMIMPLYAFVSMLTLGVVPAIGPGFPVDIQIREFKNGENVLSQKFETEYREIFSIYTAPASPFLTQYESISEISIASLSAFLNK